MYSLEGEAVSLRELQLETDACWCSNLSFLTELDGAKPDTSEEDPARLWFTVVFPRVMLRQADALVRDMPLLFPPGSWQYGCREDHRVYTQNGVPVIHSCLTVLVGCAEPMTLTSMREGIENIVPKMVLPGVDVSPCPPHLTREEGVSFLPIAAWVQERIHFIDASGKKPSPDGLQRGVFGDTGILDTLRHQFGSASAPLVTEMALAKQMADEEDGIIPGGFAPTWLPAVGDGSTIYVKTPQGTETNPIELS